MLLRCVSAVGAALIAGTALGATFVVNNNGDNGGVDPPPGAGTGTLRQAIVDANAAGGTNTINFSGLAPNTAVTLSKPLPPITSSVTIDGAGNTPTVNGNSNQAFMVDSGNVTKPGPRSRPDSPSYTGASFMPQIVQLPGWSDLIHGCIGLWK